MWSTRWSPLRKRRIAVESYRVEAADEFPPARERSRADRADPLARRARPRAPAQPHRRPDSEARRRGSEYPREECPPTLAPGGITRPRHGGGGDRGGAGARGRNL